MWHFLVSKALQNCFNVNKLHSQRKTKKSRNQSFTVHKFYTPVGTHSYLVWSLQVNFTILSPYHSLFLHNTCRKVLKVAIGNNHFLKKTYYSFSLPTYLWLRYSKRYFPSLIDPYYDNNLPYYLLSHIKCNGFTR